MDPLSLVKNLPILEQADPWLNGKCQHLFYCLANSANEDPGETSLTFYLTEYLPLLAITTDNLTVNEKTQTVATLISNQNGATLSLDGSSDNNDLFKIENNVLKFKDANGVDYDTTSAIVPEVTRGSPMPVFMTEFSSTDRAWLPMAMSFSKTLLTVTVRVFLASALPLFLALIWMV
jgi:hypothetical protein